MLSFGAKSSKKSLKSVMKVEKLELFFLLAHGLYMQEHRRELIGVTIFKQQASKVEQLEIGMVMTFKEAR